jgi:hypothetical protein
VEEVAVVVRQLAGLASEVTALDAASEIIRKVDAKLYLAFEPKQAKKRIVNKVKGGVVTLAGAEPPIEVYSGPTTRRAVKKSWSDATVEVLRP